MKEFSSLFISGYLISSFLLLPLMGLYFCSSLKRVSLGPIIQFHKVLILLSIILPACMVMISYGSHLKADLSKSGQSNQAEMHGESAAISPYPAGSSDLPVADKEDDPLPTLQDVVFYFVDLIVEFSLLGLLIFVLRYALQARRMSRIKQDGVVTTISTNCRLIESIGVKSPFSAGILRKCIFIPKDISESEKRVIVQHELNHFFCHHHVWSLLEAVLACVFWFNPVVHILRRRGAFLRELECDGRTIQKIDRYEYTRLLIKTAESIAGDSRFSLLTQGWARKGELRKRIEALMSRERVKAKTAIGIIIAVGVAVTVGVTLLNGNLNDVTKETILAEINLEYARRAPLTARVDIENVPPHFINALLVQEDSEFFEHKGIRLKSIIRASGANIKSLLSGGPLYKDGGSTITQQLAKQFINNRKRTMKRKFEELKIARVLETDFTKKEILEMYLNMIYFGNDAFGLKAASDTYFGHDYTSLTLSESAMLVPFITAPSVYNVLNDPVTAETRQKRLLERIAIAAQDS